MVKIESVTGKYAHVVVQGVEYRIYYEESGRGIPLVCQHTAGSEGRQYRHFTSDKQITSKYRVIVPDLPFHGKSLPPESEEWWKKEYKLTKSFFLDFHTEFCRALELERPVYIGCSMGGFLAPDLALERPNVYRAVIGLEASLGYGPRVLISHNWLNMWYHPRVGNDVKSACMWGMCSPTSPEKYRRETCYVYSQGAPPVFKGDLHYYFSEHDMTDGKTAKKIDTSKVAVYLLTGEYDTSCTPEDTRKLADQIEGVKFTVMKGLGHFSITEDFEKLKQYLMPVLDEIATRA